MSGLMPKMFVSGLAILVLAGTAYGDPVTLRFGIHNAAKSTGAQHGAEIFMAGAKESDDTLNFDFYPSEQAGKALEMFDLVKSGAVDIGFISTGYTSSDKLPLIGTWEIPGLATSSCAVVKAMNVLGAPGGVIYEQNFKPNGLRVLSYLPYPPYGPAAARNPITTVEDLQGLKVRSAGGLMELTVQKLGGAPVKMVAAEIYQSLQRGTLDTVLLSYLSARDLSLAEISKYATTGYSFGTPGDMIAISEERLATLTQEQQDALIAAGQATSEHWCKYVDETEAQVISDMRAGGMEIYTWTEADVAKLNELLADIPSQWAQQLDDRGLPGSDTLAAFKAELAK
jgi:TRAP-type C4-dicarboxylate transport system substrate-binding protein